MTTPTSPEGSSTMGRQSQDHDPWAPPSSEAAEVHHPPYPMPYAQPRNGMGITALVLGIVGLALGVFVILFWISWLPAGLAVIFGSLGLGHARKGLATNRAMAVSGLVMGILGLLIAVGSAVFTVVTVKHVVDDARAKVKEIKKAREERSRRKPRTRRRRKPRRRLGTCPSASRTPSATD